MFRYMPHFSNCERLAITPFSILYSMVVRRLNGEPKGGFMSSNFGISALSRVFKQSSPDLRRRVIGIYSFLIGFNILAWLLALIVFGGNAKLLLLALTAYTFGLRHAFDADHISAIDNVTRKLMQDKQRPVGVG